MTATWGLETVETVEPVTGGGRPDNEGAGAGDGLADGQTSGDVGPGAGDDLADGQTSGNEGLGVSDGLTDGQTTWDLEPATARETIGIHGKTND